MTETGGRDKRPHWSEGLPEPLPKKDLAAEYKRYVVWALFDEELMKQIVEAGYEELQVSGPQGVKISEHRVPPKKYFGLGYGGFPSIDQVWQADQMSLRCAQRKALYLLTIPGVLQVEITWWKRREATSRFTRGAVESGYVGKMRSLDDPRFVDGEPDDKAIELDKGSVA